MQHLIVHHHVKDYAAWKRVFDENRSALEEAGCRSIAVPQLGGSAILCVDEIEQVELGAPAARAA